MILYATPKSRDALPPPRTAAPPPRGEPPTPRQAHPQHEGGGVGERGRGLGVSGTRGAPRGLRTGMPRWMRVSEALDYMAGVHPRFDRARAEAFLDRTTIKRKSRVRELSKGMVTQLHLALVMAVDAKLLVLDEPTLGLDLLYRKAFYDTLLNDYFDKSRTIIVTTHQVEEIQHILTDVMFIDRGRIVLSCTMEDFE